MTKIMTEAHAAARKDFAWDRRQTSVHHVRQSYGYYLGLQMKNGFAEARRLRTGVAAGFQIVEPKRVWA